MALAMALALALAMAMAEIMISGVKFPAFIRNVNRQKEINRCRDEISQTDT